MTNQPLILITNDDGIDSPGLHATARAVTGLGEILVVAPSKQRTSAGRSYPPVEDKAIYPVELPLAGDYRAYKADVSPAQAVVLALVEIARRPIDLCVSGINYGENIGSGVTISGTVGAAIEAASFDIPALAVSLEVPQAFHLNHSDQIDFDVAAHFTRQFARQALAKGLPADVDLIKIDIPASATPETPWRSATVSRQRYYQPVFSGRRHLDEQKETGYRPNIDLASLEPDSDIHVFAIEKRVAVVPMTIDLTASIPLEEVAGFFSHG